MNANKLLLPFASLLLAAPVLAQSVSEAGNLTVTVKEPDADFAVLLVSASPATDLFAGQEVLRDAGVFMMLSKGDGTSIANLMVPPNLTKELFFQVATFRGERSCVSVRTIHELTSIADLNAPPESKDLAVVPADTALGDSTMPSADQYLTAIRGDLASEDPTAAPPAADLNAPVASADWAMSPNAPLLRGSELSPADLLAAPIVVSADVFQDETRLVVAADLNNPLEREDVAIVLADTALRSLELPTADLYVPSDIMADRTETGGVVDDPDQTVASSPEDLATPAPAPLTGSAPLSVIRVNVRENECGTHLEAGLAAPSNVYSLEVIEVKTTDGMADVYLFAELPTRSDAAKADTAVVHRVTSVDLAQAKKVRVFFGMGRKKPSPHTVWRLLAIRGF